MFQEADEKTSRNTNIYYEEVVKQSLVSEESGGSENNLEYRKYVPGGSETTSGFRRVRRP